MAVEQFRGYVAALVAATAVIGGAIGCAWAWHQASVSGITTDIALILSVFTGLIGSGTTFLFVAEGSSRATHAAERSFASGQAAGAALPAQALPPAPEPLVVQDITNGPPIGGDPTEGERG